MTISFAFASLPWLPAQLYRRTLLIATTLAAVVLGLGVWLARKVVIGICRMQEGRIDA